MNDGVAEAHAWLAAKYDAGLPPFFEGTHWTFPAHPELVKAAADDFDEPNAYPVDWRGDHLSLRLYRHQAAGRRPVLPDHDQGQGRRRAYDGGKTYRLHVPPNVPVEQYWSVTAYDRETHALIKNVDRASRASNAADVQKNADGSVDIYLGAEGAGRQGDRTGSRPTRPASSS